jgi:hypothetical protein
MEFARVANTSPSHPKKPQIEAYWHCADRRDAKGQMALFTADAHLVVYMNARASKPSQELNSRGPRSCVRGPGPVRRDHALPRAAGGWIAIMQKVWAAITVKLSA